jgi:hypothetical protein
MGGLILARTQNPSGYRTEKMHLTAGETLDRVIGVFIRVVCLLGQQPLDMAARIRTGKKERSHTAG